MVLQESSVWTKTGLWLLPLIKSLKDNVKILTRSAMMKRTKTPIKSQTLASWDRGRLILRNVHRLLSPGNSLNLSSEVKTRLSANTKTIFLLTRRLPTEVPDHQEIKITSFSSNLRCLPASVSKDNQVIAREKLAVIPENKGILAAFMVILLSLCNLQGRWFQCWSQRNRAAKPRSTISNRWWNSNNNSNNSCSNNKTCKSSNRTKLMQVFNSNRWLRCQY